MNFSKFIDNIKQLIRKYKKVNKNCIVRTSRYNLKMFENKNISSEQEFSFPSLFYFKETAQL